MPKRLTVFYSWQSDTPADFNRTFIERAIQEALNRLQSDAELEEALRGSTVELDSDTKGVAGSPPITDTILRKIENCAVFIADLTFVGKSMDGLTNASGEPRLFPNPNVLIEYGYSLRSHTHSKIIGVMNTAYGKPDDHSLPFDLRHMLWPLQYFYSESSGSTYEIQFEMLVQELVEKIGLILQSHISTPSSIDKFIPQKATKNPALFFETAEQLVTDRPNNFTVPDGAKAYLRLYPVYGVAPIDSELSAQQLTLEGNVQPFGYARDWGFDRNQFGAIVCESPKNGKLFKFTQVFLSKEIWGVDGECLNAACINEWFGKDTAPFIEIRHIEDSFINGLQLYMGFARNKLKLPLPLKIQAGLFGIKGYPIALNSHRITNKSLHDVVFVEIEISSYEKPAWEILAPFFDRIYVNCARQRTAQEHADLVRRFTAKP